jgi:outer membrane lipoprotein SlyB
MLTNKKIVSLSILTLLVACSNMGSNYSPIVDKKGVDESRYQQDLAECQNLSTDAQGAGASGAKKAAGGAAVGALIGLVGGGNSTNIAQAAGIGGVIGGASGLYSGNAEKENIIRRCLSGRGYRVLN